MKTYKSRISVAFTAAVVVSALSMSAASAAGLSGSAAVLSKYVLRGGTMAPENTGGTIQAGLTYTTEPGVYFGWWGSSLGYTCSTSGTTVTCPSAEPAAASGFENDLFVGYSMPIGGMTLDFGVVQYYYIGVEDSDGLEPYLNLTAGPVTLGLKYLTNDVIWGNSGDMYVTAALKQSIGSDFTLGGVLGYYFYDDQDEFVATTENSGFKHLDLTLSHPIAKTGLDLSISYIFGGADRTDVDQENTMVLGISGAF